MSLTPNDSPAAIPRFSALPLDPSGPPGNAWGRFGTHDNLGTLNLITPALVARAAAEEIRTGIRVPLDWSLKQPAHPSFGRHVLEHRLIHKSPRSVNDDVLVFDTQSSTQWDGLRHYAYQATGQFYGGRTQADIAADDNVLGTQHAVKAGGITGRGVLLDYAAYAEQKGIEVKHFEPDTIKLDDLKAMVAERGLQLRCGDVLLVRSGWIPAYQALDSKAQAALPLRPAPKFVGVEATREVLEWLWEMQPAAVAGDMPAFERCPFARSDQGGPSSIVLHEWLIAGWGMPIGEMFDLEALAKECERQGRWSFFVSSVHLNVPGGVASPPNAVAIF